MFPGASRAQQPLLVLPYHSAGKPLDGPLDFAIGPLAQRFLELVAMLQIVLVMVPLDPLLLLLLQLRDGDGASRGGHGLLRGWRSLPGAGPFHGCCCCCRLVVVVLVARGWVTSFGSDGVAPSRRSRRQAALLRGFSAAALQPSPIHLLLARCRARRRGGPSGSAGGATLGSSLLQAGPRTRTSPEAPMHGEGGNNAAGAPPSLLLLLLTYRPPPRAVPFKPPLRATAAD